MWFIEVIEHALSDTKYRHSLIIRAIEDCIIILKLCLEIALIGSLVILLRRWLGFE